MAAKRSAATELNHDNWDDEDPADKEEQPGTFAQASEDDLKKRVIKKAVRRRGTNNGDEAGSGGGGSSVFTGFGGFKAAAPPSSGGATGVFDFLKNGSSSSATSKGLFSFGKANEGSAAGSSSSSFSAAAPGGFTFASKSSPAPAEGGGGGGFVFGKAASSFGAFGASGAPASKATFSSGSVGSLSSPSAVSATSVFGVSNDAGDDKTNKALPGDGETKTAQTNAASAPSAATPLSELAAFKTSAGSKWTCGTCMVQNDKDKDKCICCESPNPAGGSSASSGGAEKTPKAGSKWTCGTCLVPNEADKDACVCCSEPRPGASAAKKEPGAGSANSFVGGFKLGSSGFSFGSGGTMAPSTSGSGFTFNASASTAAAPSSGFKFGKGSGTGSSSVGSLTETKASSAPLDQDKIKKIAGSSKEFLANLGALNKQFVEWVSRHVEKNCNVLLEPCFRDYEGHLQELVKRFGSEDGGGKGGLSPAAKANPSSQDEPPAPPKPPAAVSAPTPSPFSGAVFGSGASSTGTVSTTMATGFTFSATKPSPAAGLPVAPSVSGSSGGGFFFGGGAAKSAEGTATGVVDKPPPFTFGTASSTTTTFGSGSLFGQAAFGGAKKVPEDGEKAGEAEDDEDQPPKVEVKQVSEDDAIYSVKCKLFYKKGTEFVDKGVGMLHIKKVIAGDNVVEDGQSSQKVQMLVRAETNLGNILLNIRLSQQISFVRRNNNLQFVCVPNPPIPGLTPGTPVTMLVKVKGPDVATILEEEIKKALVASSSLPE